MYFNGFGCEMDKRKAFEMYEKSALQDNLIAQCNLGTPSPPHITSKLLFKNNHYL